MRSLKLKTICNLAASAVHTSLQTGTAPLGVVRNVRTVEITDIPDDVPNHKVVLLWDRTADASYLKTADGEYPRHSYQFSEIGDGTIIR